MGAYLWEGRTCTDLIYDTSMIPLLHPDQIFYFIIFRKPVLRISYNQTIAADHAPYS